MKVPSSIQQYVRMFFSTRSKQAHTLVFSEYYSKFKSKLKLNTKYSYSPISYQQWTFIKE